MEIYFKIRHKNESLKRLVNLCVNFLNDNNKNNF